MLKRVFYCNTNIKKEFVNFVNTLINQRWLEVIKKIEEDRMSIVRRQCRSESQMVTCYFTCVGQLENIPEVQRSIQKGGGRDRNLNTGARTAARSKYEHRQLLNIEQICFKSYPSKLNDQQTFNLSLIKQIARFRISFE